MNPTPRRGPILLCVLLGALAGCASVNVPEPPTQGPTAAPAGGVAGYQHGAAGARFAVGPGARRVAENGYLKQRGDEGTIAVKQSNGSVFSVPAAHAASLSSPPYGSSPQDHDAYVRAYFGALGLPLVQVGTVRAMTLLEASGRSDEAAPAVPRVKAYYSVLGRTVAEVPVPDSFAWARANAAGGIVQEGVYWPPLPAEVMAELGRFKALLADPQRRQAFESRLPASSVGGTLTIRHSPATEDGLEAFASLDVAVRVAAPADRSAAAGAGRTGAQAPGAVVVRHFDITGSERFVPGERRDLGNRYPAQKVATPSAGRVQSP